MSTTTSADADPRAAACAARAASRAFAAAPTAVRVAALENLAAGLLARSGEILAANAADLAAASEKGSDVEPALLQRLKLTEAKLETLASGIRAIAAAREPLGAASSRVEIAEGLTLEKTACPIGVLLVIFESRPDALPQIAALAIRSGNGLLLKGGKEASRSNAVLHEVVVDAISKATSGAQPPVNAEGLISLITSRAGVSDLLKLDDVIDLVIPRGGNALVTHVQSSTRIPVLGHADGVCHIFVDEGFPVEEALPIILDSKLDYPAACNAVETLLVHSSHASAENSGEGKSELSKLVEGLQQGGVTVRAWRSEEDGSDVGGASKEGDTAAAFELLSSLPPAPARRHEYGSADLTIELVPSTASEDGFLFSLFFYRERKKTKKTHSLSPSTQLSSQKKKKKTFSNSRGLPHPRPRQRPHRRDPLPQRRLPDRVRQFRRFCLRFYQRLDPLCRRLSFRAGSRGRDQYEQDSREGSGRG
jgi:delta-1-pyrroline-5-carboxylate synthetase